MKSGAVILGTAVSAILLMVAGFLYLMTDDKSEERYRESITLVRQIQQLSSDWSIEISRVESNPLADFDSLATFIPRMARLKDGLSGTAQSISDFPDGLANDLNAFISAIEAKEERIERFKTGYAVVRNSKAYLPLAAANVVQQAQELEIGVVVRSISNLIRDVNLYLSRPTATSEARLMAEIQELRKASVVYAPSLANALANLYSHAEVLVTKQGPTEALFVEATSNEISVLSDQLASRLEFELGKKVVLMRYYDRGILIVFGVLALFWLLFALQQRIRVGVVTTQMAPHAPTAQAEVVVPDQVPADVDETAAAAFPIRRSVDGRALSGEQDSLLADHSVGAALLVHGFVGTCVAGTLKASVQRISGRMDYLRQIAHKIQDSQSNSDVISELDDRVDLEEDIESVSAIATSVRQQVNVIGNLAQRLESFSSILSDDVDRSMIDINACIKRAVETAGAEATTRVAKNLDDIPEIFASETEFHLLLTKIIENSVIAVQERDDGKGVIKIDTERKDAEILITIIDNGPGIPSDRRMKIFKPFYTSRDGAMGIGLTLAGYLARKYEGNIRINSLLGQGTMVRITLPASIPNA